jgi:hypothetical protein
LFLCFSIQLTNPKINGAKIKEEWKWRKGEEGELTCFFGGSARCANSGQLLFMDYNWIKFRCISTQIPRADNFFATANNCLWCP